MLVEYIDIIMIALSGVLFTVMVDNFIDEGQIFSFWHWVLQDNDSWYLKPLWGCAYCTNIWVIGIMLVLFHFVPIVWAVLLTLSTGSWVVGLLYKYDLE